MANGTQDATAQHMPIKLITTVAYNRESATKDSARVLKVVPEQQ